MRLQDLLLETLIGNHRSFRLDDDEGNSSYRDLIQIRCARTRWADQQQYYGRGFDPYHQLKKQLSRYPDDRRAYFEEKLMRKLPRRQMEQTIDNGVYREYVWLGRAVSYWKLNGWATSVIVPLKVLDGDESEAVLLRNRIRDRILAYYATLY